MISTKNLIAAIDEVPERQIYGRVTAVLGMLVEVGGAAANLSVGGRCQVIARDGHQGWALFVQMWPTGVNQLVSSSVPG